MISFFPAPYPDELWYSVICRFHVRSGNYCAKHTMQQLYGDTYRTPSLMLCGGINTLLPQLSQGYLHTKDIVMQHTLYPYYARFFSTQRKRSTYAYTVNGNPAAVHRMGISQANGTHCSVMRYCPVCYQEDLQLYGEPYGIAVTNCRICRFVPNITAGWSIPTSHTIARDSKNYFLQHLL